MIQPFTTYDNYTDIHNKDPLNYDMGYDSRGPQFMAPFQCLSKFSFVQPRRSSPIIAVIGTQNDVTDRMSSYFHAIFKTQTKATPSLKFLLPNYKV
jgi:hypothetical protein